MANDDKYVFLEARLNSFQKWPLPKSYKKVTPANLSKAGFYYLPFENSIDNVCCVYCGKQLEGWEKGDDPLLEHKTRSSLCPFLNLEQEQNRLLTFKNWPHNRSYKATPRTLAAFGWYYSP
eukprot:Sdes_comp18649_c0_seq1m8856